MENMGENNVVDIESAPIIRQVVFHEDEPALPPAIPTSDADRTAPLSDFGAAPADQVPTKTVTPKSAIPTSIWGRKSNPNRTGPTDGLGAESEIAADHDSDVTLAADRVLVSYEKQEF